MLGSLSGCPPARCLIVCAVALSNSAAAERRVLHLWGRAVNLLQRVYLYRGHLSAAGGQPGSQGAGRHARRVQEIVSHTERVSTPLSVYRTGGLKQLHSAEAG